MVHVFGGGVGNVLTFHSLAPMSFVKHGKKGLKGLDLEFQNGLLMSTGEKDERGLGGIGFPDRPTLGKREEKDTRFGRGPRG